MLPTSSVHSEIIHTTPSETLEERRWNGREIFVIKTSLGFAAVGALLGAFFGPLGATAGAVTGFVIGLFFRFVTYSAPKNDTQMTFYRIERSHSYNPSLFREILKKFTAILPTNGLSLRLIQEKFFIDVENGDLLKKTMGRYSCAIVNAANTHLETRGNGGVNGAVISAGGDEYVKAHDTLRKFYRNTFETGRSAAMIPSGKLQERGIDRVIVIAGPNLSQPRANAQVSTQKDKDELYSCYYNSLLLADAAKTIIIRFPAISIGIFKFPANEAARIALQAICQFRIDHPNTYIRRVQICLRNDPNKSNDPKPIDSYLEAIRKPRFCRF